MVELVETYEKYLFDYKEAYFLSLEAIKNGLIKEHDMMFEDLSEVNIIQKFKDSKDLAKLKPGYVPAYNYFLVEDNKLLGVVNIRISLTENLLQYGGHIGYGINPKYWKMGYGTKILELALIKAKEIGIKDRVLVTCDDDNVGSYKIIEKNGGILENKITNTDGEETFLTRRYWIDISK